MSRRVATVYLRLPYLCAVGDDINSILPKKQLDTKLVRGKLTQDAANLAPFSTFDPLFAILIPPHSGLVTQFKGALLPPLCPSAYICG